MSTNYNIKGTGIAVTDELRTYVESRLEHTEKFLADDPTAHVDVEIQYLEEGRSGKFRAEFTLSCGGNVYRAEHWGTTAHEAIDMASARLKEELSRNKKKRLDVFRHTAVKVKEYLRGWRRKI